MTTTFTNTSNASSVAWNQSSQLPRTTRASKRKAEKMSVATDGEPATKRPYLGKCQYKTGKCFNERTLKRNGDAHSLCEEHRIKQNLIQRRSDRKYQKVHAIRRRERSQRRAVLKKQISMAMNQRLFYKHQHQQPQTNLGIPLAQYGILPFSNYGAFIATDFGCLAMGIQAPQHPSGFILDNQGSIGSPMVLSYSATGATTPWPPAGVHDGLSPSGIDDYTPYSFQNVPGVQVIADAPQYSETKDCSRVGEGLSYLPVGSRVDDNQTWSEADLEFLQNLLQVYLEDICG